MTTVLIDETTREGKWLLDLIRKQKGVEVVEKKSFREAAEECGAVSVDEFCDELDRLVKKRYDEKRCNL